MKANLRWVNIFIRDLLVSMVLVGINWTLNYQSWFAAMLLGMQMVLMAWHLEEYLKLNKGLEDATTRCNNNTLNSARFVHSIL